MTEQPPEDDLFLWKRVPRDDDHDYGMAVARGPGLLKKPTVVVLGGIPSAEPREVNGYMKWAEVLLGRFGMNDNAVQIIGVQYPMEAGAIREFAREHMRELVTDGHGVKLPLPQAKRNLRNLHFFCHSAGGEKLKAIREEFTAELAELSYKPAEQNALNRQVFALTVGSAATLREEVTGAPFTAVHVLNQEDVLVRLSTPENTQLLQELMQERRQHTPRTVKFPPEGFTDPDTGVPSEHPPQVMVSELQAGRQWLLSVDRLLPRLKVGDQGAFEEIEPYTRNPRGDSTQHRLDEHIKLGYAVEEYQPAAENEQRKLAQYGLLLPTAIASILRNAVDNSVRNAKGIESGERFQPLPGIRKLLEVKEHEALAFGIAEETAIGAYAKLPNIARGIGYDRRITRSMKGIQPGAEPERG